MKIKPTIWIFMLLGLAMLLLGCRPAADAGITLNGVTVPPVPDLDPQQVAQGEVLYNQYCAECHGANLEGEPNWQSARPDGSFPAPPHDDSGHTWHHPDDYLMDVITRGGPAVYNGTMPGFGSQLSASEIEMILDYIKSDWGQEAREFQWWISAQ